MVEILILPVAIGLLALCVIAIKRLNEHNLQRRPVSSTGGADWTPSASNGFWSGDNNSGSGSSGSSWSDSCSLGSDGGGSCGGGDGGGGGGGD